ncbi:hypothetical protein cypCar_00034325 [Cyprinus carpio]|nr:hypothetical protein cypCar_00034325 [Cyprinus carpio]
MEDSMTVYDNGTDGRFRDRLKLDDQTGSLTITNITTEHTGHYQLQINSVIKNFSLTVYGSGSLIVLISVAAVAGSLLIVAAFGIFLMRRKCRKTDQKGKLFGCYL